MRHRKNSVFGNHLRVFHRKTKFSNPIENFFYSGRPQRQQYRTTTVSLLIVKMFRLYDSRSNSVVKKDLKTMYFQFISMRLLGERKVIRSVRSETIEDKVMHVPFELIFTFGQSVINSSTLRWCLVTFCFYKSATTVIKYVEEPMFTATKTSTTKTIF